MERIYNYFFDDGIKILIVDINRRWKEINIDRLEYFITDVFFDKTCVNLTSVNVFGIPSKHIEKKLIIGNLYTIRDKKDKVVLIICDRNNNFYIINQGGIFPALKKEVLDIIDTFEEYLQLEVRKLKPNFNISMIDQSLEMIK